MSHRKFLSGFTSRSIPTTPAHGDVHGITTKLSTGLYTASVTREKNHCSVIHRPCEQVVDNLASTLKVF
ncbi:hypothetical protein CULC0102_2354 [Corynebacterium ulcerans 0102]|nr:hypothetical protein CULC0102_2354 [Corynebacterium ulcerans 0102]